MDAATYAATERLRNGATLQVRALRLDDRAEMLAAVGRFSKQTLYRRFFAPKRSFSEREIEFFLNVDFVGHVALVAVLSEDGRQVIAGGARYIVSQPGHAEVAFAIDDPHQKLGIATHLINHLIRIARRRGTRGVRGRGAAREYAHAEGLRTLWPCYDDAQRTGCRPRDAGSRW